MDDLTLLKGQYPKKDWYWRIIKFSNRGSRDKADNFQLSKNIREFFDEVNMDSSTEIEKIEYLNDSDKFTDVFITYRHKLSEEELEDINKHNEKFFEKRIESAKDSSEKEDLPNEIARNLWILREILNESPYGFAWRTRIKESDIKDVESGKMGITDEMLRAIKERFPSISIKTFTNGEREDF